MKYVTQKEHTRKLRSFETADTEHVPQVEAGWLDVILRTKFVTH
jgi:hypothetical protein